MAIIDHPELIQVIAEIEDAPGDITTIMRCRGGYHGKIVNKQWHVVRCRHRKCRRKGFETYHVWDIHTGEESTQHVPLPGGMKGDNQ